MKGICLRSTLDVLLWETPTVKGCLGSHIKMQLKKIKGNCWDINCLKQGG